MSAPASGGAGGGASSAALSSSSSAAAASAAASGAAPPAPRARSPFTFYAVLDFEATCWKDEPAKQAAGFEIIEFPTVLFKLTGIAQATVGAARALPEVLAAHTEWLRDSTADASLESVVFVTCGDWDLKTALPHEARNKGLEVHAVYRRWINIKVEYTAMFRRPSRGGMAGMLHEQRIPLEGHHHSGLDDCRNIGTLLQRIVAKAHTPAFTLRRVEPSGV